MLSTLVKKPSYSYVSIASSGQDVDGSPATRTHLSTQRCRWNLVLQMAKILCWSLAFTLIGFYLGHLSAHHGRALSTALVLETRPHLFEHENVYGSEPSDESNAAWSLLMPKRGGFFTHPEIAPKRSAYAVFHQLHCLVGLLNTSRSISYADYHRMLFVPRTGQPSMQQRLQILWIWTLFRLRFHHRICDIALIC